jgi:hypothetical protein
MKNTAAETLAKINDLENRINNLKAKSDILFTELKNPALTRSQLIEIKDIFVGDVTEIKQMLTENKELLIAHQVKN